MIAFCDILGFKEMLRSQPLTHAQGALTFLRALLANAILQRDPGNPPPSLAEIRRLGDIGFACFSDNVLLYALDDSDESALRIVEVVGWMLFRAGFSSRIAVRGALAYGEMAIDPENDLYAGKPLVEGVALEADQEWAGATLCESAVQRIRQIDFPIDDHVWLTRYPAPLKSRTPPEERFVVNWTFGAHLPTTLHWSRQSPEATAADEANRPSVVAKWRNTKRFHARACRLCR